MYDLMFVFTEGSPEVADPNAWQSCNIFDAGLHISVIDTRRDILNIYEKIYWRQCYNIYNAIYL